MKKNSKKVLLSLATTVLLSTSVGYAQNINYKDTTYYKNYNNQFNRKVYVTNYNNYSNRSSNKKIIKYLPINESWNNNWSWDYNWSWNDNNTSKPTKPNTSKPEDKPDANVDIEKEDDNKPVDNNNNEKPNTKPETNIGANNSIEIEVVRLVNIERQKEGLAPLTHSGELSNVARMKSQDMADNNYFSHNSPTYGDPFAMMRNFGINYKTAGENIAKGYSSAQSVVKGWMNSSGHRANILNPSFGTIGVGYVNINGTTYWTQMFTN